MLHCLENQGKFEERKKGVSGPSSAQLLVTVVKCLKNRSVVL